MAKWYRGGEGRGDWFTSNREYAEFYGAATEWELSGNFLDLTGLGVDVDEDVLVGRGLPGDNTASGEMYEWAERNRRVLYAMGYDGVIVMQWNADFSSRAFRSLLLFARARDDSSRPR